MKKLLIAFTLATLTFVVATSHATQLVIGANPVDGQQRNAFYKQIDLFKKQHPHVNVTIKAVEHELFKSTVTSTVGSKKPYADVLFWFGGASLKHFANNDWLKDLSPLWKKNHWHSIFTASSRQAVTQNERQYGLPLFYYQWGIYYRKSIFSDLGLSPPETWEELLTINQILLENNITPFTLGSKNNWPAAGWFDYLNLRLNGLAFHEALLTGCIPYNDDRVRTVFNYWGQLVNSKTFIKNADRLDWKASLPYLYHKKAAMLLMGNFFTITVPDNLKNDIGFFPFPQINPDIPLYEDAPIDVAIVPKYAKNYGNASRFLEFLARADVQSELSADLHMIPPNNNAKLVDNEQIQQGAELLAKAEGLAQFFDRDTHPNFTKVALPSFVDFMRNPKNLDAILDQLEHTRTVVWPELATAEQRNLSDCYLD